MLCCLLHSSIATPSCLSLPRLTCSHRPALETFHDVKLELDGAGSYRVDTIEHGAVASLPGASHAVAAPTANRLVGVAAASHVQIASNVVPAGQDVLYPPLPSPAVAPVSFIRRLRWLLSICVPSWRDRDAFRLAALAATVLVRVALSHRIAHLNGSTVKLLLQNDQTGFKRLVLIR